MQYIKSVLLATVYFFKEINVLPSAILKHKVPQALKKTKQVVTTTS